MAYARYLLGCGVAVCLSLVLSPSASADQIIRCRSENYEYNHCATRQRGKVRLMQQISKSACIEGRTWGYDRRGVWVDQGCEAKFRITTRQRERNDRSGNRGRSLVCRSDNYTYNHCRDNEVSRGGRVRLVRQISKSSCIEHETWGTDRRGIWVDEGCEAEFRILPPRRDRANRDRDILRCSSSNYEYEHCQADTRSGVRLAKQLSEARCIENETWGYDRRGIWVDKGCSGEFRLVSRRAEDNRPLPGNKIQCQSKNYAYEHCRADTRNGVRLIRQLSNASCIQDRTWGYDRRGVWVDQGCEAEFQVGARAANPVGNALEQALDTLLAPPQ